MKDLRNELFTLKPDIQKTYETNFTQKSHKNCVFSNLSRNT